MTSCVLATVITRLSAYDKKGLFNPRYGFISDVDIELRLAHGRDAGYAPELLSTSTPREPNYTFAFVNWRYHFWIRGMFVESMKRYRLLYPMGIAHLRDALALWQDADDYFSRSLGYFSGNNKYLPDWYDRSHWNTCSVR